MNISIIFHGTDSTKNYELEVFHNSLNGITVSIDTKETYYPSIITLDKATAIKLTRVLKSEISKIQ